MKLIKIKAITKELVESPLFTGGRVSRQPLVPKGTSKYFNMNLINFGKGARNKWHKHDTDQILIVTKGKGIVASGKRKQKVEKGDIVLIPSGEKHWHGATANSAFSHISLTTPKTKLTQIEK